MTTAGQMSVAGTAPVAPAQPPARPAAAPAVSALTRDFLTWVAAGPRSYAETMDAWRSSCPRLTIWEDALGDGLVRVERETGVTPAELRVLLTARGRALLGAC